jgi:hypothetical protein
MGDNPPLFTDSDVDAFAREFLRSPYASPIYADWSVDRRLDTFLRRQGFSHVADNGDVSNIVLHRIMAYGGILLRDWHVAAEGSPAGAHRVH